MKNKICLLLLCVGIVGTMSSCKQGIVREFGGEMTIDLEPGQKLEEITWKDDNLWYLTRPMTDNDVAVTHTFREESSMGVFEGTVTVVEHVAE